MLDVLRQRNFALLWIGQCVSVAGDWVLLVALPFFIYARTGSPLATGAIFVAQTLPGVALSSLAGVFADRWDRRRTMVACDLARAALLLPLLLAGTSDRLWIVYVVAFAQSCISQFFDPAFDALLPALVEPERLIAANALNSLRFPLTRVIGSLAGGTLLATMGLTSVVLADTASFVVSAALLSMMTLAPFVTAAAAPTEHAVRARIAAFRRSWAQGLAVIAHDAVLRTIFAVVGLIMLAQGIIGVLLVVFVKDVVGGDAQVFGWVATAGPAGGFLGALVVGRAGANTRPAWLIGACELGAGACIVLMLRLPALPVVLLTTALGGSLAAASQAVSRALRQARVDDRYRGRVSGTQATAIALAQLAGMIIAGALGGVAGTVLSLEVAAALILLAGVLALKGLRGVALGYPRPAPLAPRRE